MIKFFVLSCCFTICHQALAQNVGIGINTPAVPLHVKSNTDEMLRLQGNNPYVSFSNFSGVPKGYVQGYGDNLLVGTIIGNTTGKIQFYTNNNLNMTIDPNSNIGIGTTTPTSPLSFANALGNKISFWNSGTNADYGIGINSGVMQLYTAGQDKIAFGYGNANAFNETLGIHTGTGMLAYPNVLGNKISFWRNGPNNDFGIGINSGVMQLYTAGQDKIAFGWGNANPGAFTETITFYTGSGRIGLGTTTPQTRLHIAQDNEAIRLSGNQTYLTFYNGSTYKGYLWNKGTNDMELGIAAGNINGNLYLSRDGVPSLTVQSDGRVRIGGTIPSANGLLAVNGDLTIKKAWGNLIGEWSFHYSDVTGGSAGDEDDLMLLFNGGVPKATISDVDGDYTSSSDYRLKENFKNYRSVLNGIKKLDVLTYHYKADKSGKRSFGLVAQNLQQYFPELVSGKEGKDSYLGISYSKTGVLAIKAIQEQQVIIEDMAKEIAVLKEQNQKLFAALDKLLQDKKP